MTLRSGWRQLSVKIVRYRFIHGVVVLRQRRTKVIAAVDCNNFPSRFLCNSSATVVREACIKARINTSSSVVPCRVKETHLQL